MKLAVFSSLLICLITAYSCNRTSNDDNNKLEKEKKDIIQSIEQKSDSIQKSCFVIHYYPDSINKEYLISINSESQYEQVILDNMEANFEILQYLDSMNIETIILDDSFFIFENDTIYRNELANKYFGFILIKENQPYEFDVENYRKRLRNIDCR